MLGDGDVADTLAARPSAFVNLGPAEWERLERLWDDDSYRDDFEKGAANGRAFAVAPDALNGRPPRIVEWTGPRRAPGDEVVPADLRVDHVYLVSCKYLSKVLHNSSPQRLVDGHLTYAPLEERGDWYQLVAPRQVETLYQACIGAIPPDRRAPLVALDAADRRTLAKALAGGWPAGGPEAYAELCTAVSQATAARWAAGLTRRNREAMLWRLLRIGSAPYFVLGASPVGSMRLRIDTPWDWREHYELRALDVTPQPGGQPRIGWRAGYRIVSTGAERIVEGHVELRWSHGRFSGPPEAKVYLDTPHDQVPGYHPLDSVDSVDSIDSVEPCPAELPPTDLASSAPMRLFDG
jgi:hypothetical protein